MSPDLAQKVADHRCEASTLRKGIIDPFFSDACLHTREVVLHFGYTRKAVGGVIPIC